MQTAAKICLICVLSIAVCRATASECSDLFVNSNVIINSNANLEISLRQIDTANVAVVSDDVAKIAVINGADSKVHLVKVGAAESPSLHDKTYSLAVKIWGVANVMTWIGYKFANLARAGGHHAWYTDSYTNSIMNFGAIGLAHSFLVMETKMDSPNDRLKLSYFVAALAAVSGISTEFSPFDAQDLTLQLVSSAAYPAVYWLSLKSRESFGK